MRPAVSRAIQATHCQAPAAAVVDAEIRRRATNNSRAGRPPHVGGYWFGRRSGWVILALLLVLWICRQWVWMPVIVSGSSMEPALHNGQMGGVNKLAYRWDPIRRGDIVAVWTGRELIVKRVLGLPEEEVAAHKGIFYVNGKPLPEPYVKFQDVWEIAAGRIGSDSFVIAGDNRSESFIAVVKRSRIVGRFMAWHGGMHESSAIKTGR